MLFNVKKEKKGKKKEGSRSKDRRQKPSSLPHLAPAWFHTGLVSTSSAQGQKVGDCTASCSLTPKRGPPLGARGGNPRMRLWGPGAAGKMWQAAGPGLSWGQRVTKRGIIKEKGDRGTASWERVCTLPPLLAHTSKKWSVLVWVTNKSQ